MARKNYKIEEVLISLRKKRDIRIKENIIYLLTDTVFDDKLKKIVTNPEKSFDLGNGSWGKIDFLTHYRDYRIVKVSSFKNS